MSTEQQFHLNVNIKEEMDEMGIREKREPWDDTSLANGTHWFTGNLQVQPEMKEEEVMNVVKSEPFDDMAMTDKWLMIKDEPQADEKESLTTFASNQPASSLIVGKRETCECTGDCLHCIEADTSKETMGNDISIFESLLGDDSDRMPSDWFCSESSDSEEEIAEVATADAALTVSTVSLSVIKVSHFPTKAEPLPYAEISLSTFASSQPASPSIVIKGETCQCTGPDCRDCQAKRCPECGITFSNKGNLKIHLRVHTGERPYVCGQCPKAFKQLGHFTRHQATHQAVRSKPFHCTAKGCGKAFTRKDELKIHFRAHMSKRQFICTTEGCEKAFTTKQELTVHFRSHTERPFVCALCPKTFNQQWNLTQHQLTHQAVRSKPFRCVAEGCGKGFTTKQHLALHFRSHTGDKPYKCNSCGKAFTQSSNLTVHFRTHTGERPYTCPLCPKAFSRSSNAKKHQRTAHPT